MKIKYSVTFEFPLRAPVTHRGTVEASTVGTCARRAIQIAKTELRPVNWSSMVFVALERLDVASDMDELEDAEDASTGEPA